MSDYLDKEYDYDSAEFISSVDELPLWSAPFGVKLLNTIKLRRDLKVLDIGSGTGFPMLELAQRLGTSSFVYGLDPYQAAIKRIEQKIRVYGLSNAEIRKGVAEEMPFYNQFFDLIISNNGLNNVSDLAKSMDECYRVAADGAQFVFTYNLPETMKLFYDIFKETLDEMGLKTEAEKIKEHIFTKRKTILEMSKFVKKSGFFIQNIDSESFSMSFVDGTAFLNYWLIRIGFMEPWKEVCGTNNIHSIFEKIEDKLNNISKRNGGIKLEIPFACFECYKR